MNFPSLTPREHQVMMHIWQHGFAEDHKLTIAAMAPPKPSMASFTNSLNRLGRKGYLTTGWHHRPIVPFPLYQREMLSEFTRKVFPGGAKAVLTLMAAKD